MKLLLTKWEVGINDIGYDGDRARQTAIALRTYSKNLPKHEDKIELTKEQQFVLDVAKRKKCLIR